MTSTVSPFETYPRFAIGKWGIILDFIVSLSSTSCMKGVLVLVLHYKDNKTPLNSYKQKVKTTSFLKSFGQ